MFPHRSDAPSVLSSLRHFPGLQHTSVLPVLGSPELGAALQGESHWSGAEVQTVNSITFLYVHAHIPLSQQFCQWSGEQGRVQASSSDIAVTSRPEFSSLVNTSAGITLSYKTHIFFRNRFYFTNIFSFSSKS